MPTSLKDIASSKRYQTLGGNVLMVEVKNKDRGPPKIFTDDSLVVMEKQKMVDNKT
jgi:hypothetical protein